MIDLKKAPRFKDKRIYWGVGNNRKFFPSCEDRVSEWKHLYSKIPSDHHWWWNYCDHNSEVKVSDTAKYKLYTVVYPSGCYIDKTKSRGTRIFGSKENSRKSKYSEGIEACSRMCSQVPGEFFGLQNQVECWCSSDVYSFAGKAFHGESKKCENGRGGFLSMSVYEYLGSKRKN